ncbi:MAG TPA: GNAT family N-acetyltransferase [Chlamydiales bacterium]|nr:GNAT family N-acetyltransferase [Chlamydiales bacterium]
MLKTERLLLRPWKEEDLAPFAQISANPKVTEFFPSPLTRAESDARAAKFQKGITETGYGLWAVELLDTHQFIGYIGIQKVPFQAHFTPAHEIGWGLSPAHWGHGYATEGAQASLDFGFTHLSLPKVVAFTVPANLRSRKVMERLGMHHNPADNFEHPLLPPGHPLRLHVLYIKEKS